MWKVKEKNIILSILIQFVSEKRLKVINQEETEPNKNFIGHTLGGGVWLNEKKIKDQLTGTEHRNNV